MDLLTIFLFIVALALSITLHEFMHAFVSFQLGDETAKYSGRLSLNPLRHIDPFATVLLPLILFISGLPVIGAAKPVPFNPTRLRYGDFGAALVAVGGPLTNLGLAAFFSIWLRLLPTLALMEDFFVILIVINVGFFVFNMIPFPPLDGSRLLYALAPEGLRGIMRQLENLGFLGILIFFFLFLPVFSPVLGALIDRMLGLLL